MFLVFFHTNWKENDKILIGVQVQAPNVENQNLQEHQIVYYYAYRP